ncbi:hypothetical protein XFF6166_810002 [Xanthomonas citri pv. fuscans]|nr:hypothetical protein XFF6166_810002 [Xanthomonas citri pv. fuscans]SOO02802.1 hypothetical protein XFF6960_700015 [Xanthomonas citri pv. fuscans]SOO04723.1 hypothetical protein XFF7767_290015 [Xanthomonas citri pv. fuscans]SOO10299.1 hypothetical protein XFF6970_520002 [Xanthomonas citri pv. fuscans]SOO16469.1 hypothetical protein XFF7766_790015 [Xanthomonas citri pv. fuscans]
MQRWHLSARVCCTGIPALLRCALRIDWRYGDAALVYGSGWLRSNVAGQVRGDARAVPHRAAPSV